MPGPGPEIDLALGRLRERLGPGVRLIAASQTAWPEPPSGVEVVVAGNASRGERLDRAVAVCDADVLAFLDPQVELPPGWENRALDLMRDPSVGAAGGAHLLPAGASRRQRAAYYLLRSRLGTGPFAFRFRRSPARDVAEIPISNAVVRRSAFLKVGGFQSPTPLGDDTRLCFKLRTLSGLRVVYDPGLAVAVAPPEAIGPLVQVVGSWGWQRGDLARRLPETSLRGAYLVPPAALLLACVILGLSPFLPVARLLTAAGLAAYLACGAWIVAKAEDRGAGVLAALALPLLHIRYAAGFVRGFLGRSLAEQLPTRSRQGPLRILVLNWRDIAHPWAGGAEGYVHELASRWVAEGCEVGWVSARYPGTRRVEVIDGIRIHRVGGALTVYLMAALTYLSRLRDRYDVIVDCENGIPFFSPMYTRKPVVLLVHHVHAEVFRSELPGYLRWLALWLEGWLMPRVYRRAPVVAVSPSTRDELAAGGWDPARIAVISNGVTPAPPAPPVLKSDSPTLLYLGRLRRYKSVGVLLRALPQIMERVPETTLAIVGQGPERHELEKEAWKLGLADVVRFHGFLERAERDRLLARSWLLVCPSAFEGFGVTCLEAGSAGTAVVASKVGGLKDAVVDGQTGVLVPYGDPEALAAACVSLLLDTSRREEMGRAGRAWAAEHGWGASAARFLDLLRLTQRPVTGGVQAEARR